MVAIGSRTAAGRAARLAVSSAPPEPFRAEVSARHGRATLFALGWLGFAAVFTVQSLSGYEGPGPAPVARTLAYHLLEAAFWAAASLGLHRAVGRSRLTRKAPAGALLLGAILAASAAAILWMAVVTWALDPHRSHSFGWQPVALAAQSTFAYAVLLAGLLTAASTAVHLSDEARDRAWAQARAEAELVRERLEMLTLHLQPHFLFNTLNTIVGLVPAQPEQAVDLVHRLSTLLRAALQHAGSTLAPLEQELALADQFLGIARVRYGSRLTIEVQVPTELRTARVPLMLLQPLLENAVKHTVELRSGPGHIRLAVSAVATGIELRVEDDGVGLCAPTVPARGAGTGIGLQTTRQRLAMLYGEAASLVLLPRAEGGACAVVHLPTA